MDELFEFLFGIFFIFVLGCLFIEYVLPVLLISSLILAPAGLASFFIGRMLLTTIREQDGLSRLSISTLIIVTLLSLYTANIFFNLAGNWQQVLAVSYVVPAGIFIAWLILDLSSENTPAGKTYQASDNSGSYRFSFEKQSDGTWRAYIKRQPSYLGRASDAHSTHRHTAPDGRHYICWSTSLHTLSDAKQVAALWTKATQEYIRTGKRF